MSFGKDSSVFFVLDGTTLVDIIRADTNADKQPLDTVEEEVYRIFHEHKNLLFAMQAIAKTEGATVGNLRSVAKQAIEEAEKI